MKKIVNFAMSLVLVLSYAVFIPIPKAVAAVDVCTWDGSTNANWSDGTNWTGCDNGGVPEAGDTLTFPVGASNIATNNDLGVLTFDTVNVFGDGYTFSGNDINVQNVWAFYGDNNTVSSTTDINYINASSSTFHVNAASTGNVIDGNIDLNLTAGGDMNINLSEDLTHNGFISGSTDIFYMGGSTNSWITSSTQLSTFTAANSVNIADGYFQCRNDNCFGDSSNIVQTTGTGSIHFNDPSVTIANDMAFGSSASPQLNVQTGTVNLTGTFDVSSAGSLYVQAADLIVDGVITFSSDAYFLGSSATVSSILLNGTISGASTGNTFANSVFFGVSGINTTYNGHFIVQPGAAIEAYSSTSLGSSIGITEIQPGATLYADSTIVVAEPLSVSGTGVGAGNFTAAIVSNMNSREYSGPVSLAGNTTIRTIANGDLEFSGPISGTGNIQINTGGLTGEVSFSGASANTYTGTTTSTDSNLGLYKSSGVVAIPGDLYIASVASDSQTLNNGGEQIADTAKVIFSQSGGPTEIASMQVGATDTVGSIAGNGSVVIIGPQVFLVGNDNTSTAFSGIIYGGGTLEKIGTGTLTLSGTNPGPVAPFVVTGGTLKVLANYSASAFSVNSGATLKGTGSTGATTVGAGGTFASGTSPGCLTVASLVLAATSIFEQEIDSPTACSGYDQTTVTGAANLNGATLNIVPGYTPTPGTVFTIIQAGSVNGTFSGLADGATTTVSGVEFRINYTGTTVILTALGGTLAPTGQATNWINYLAATLLLLSAGGMIYVWQRKRRQV